VSPGSTAGDRSNYDLGGRPNDSFQVPTNMHPVRHGAELTPDTESPTPALIDVRQAALPGLQHS
jgi:hypothetical protein